LIGDTIERIEIVLNNYFELKRDYYLVDLQRNRLFTNLFRSNDRFLALFQIFTQRLQQRIQHQIKSIQFKEQEKPENVLSKTKTNVSALPDNMLLTVFAFLVKKFMLK
jgi:hypothetical protein